MWNETINEEMGHTVMRLCRNEDYGELHRLLIGRIAWKEGADEGHSILHDIATILKMAKDDFPDERDEKYIIGRAYPNTIGQTTQFNSIFFLTDLETWFKKWFAVYTKG